MPNVNVTEAYYRGTKMTGVFALVEGYKPWKASGRADLKRAMVKKGAGYITVERTDALQTMGACNVKVKLTVGGENVGYVVDETVAASAPAQETAGSDEAPAGADDAAPEQEPVSEAVIDAGEQVGEQSDEAQVEHAAE